MIQKWKHSLIIPHINCRKICRWFLIIDLILYFKRCNKQNNFQREMNVITFCTPIFKLHKCFKEKSMLIHFVLQFSNYINVMYLLTRQMQKSGILKSQFHKPAHSKTFFQFSQNCSLEISKKILWKRMCIEIRMNSQKRFDPIDGSAWHE